MLSLFHSTKDERKMDEKILLVLEDIKKFRKTKDEK